MADQHPWIPPRPQTPQALLHRLPDKPDSSSSSSMRRPSKYIVLIMGSTAVAGKVQIATTVAKTLACPLYQGDSLHESSAKAAGLGTGANSSSSNNSKGPNEQRYKRMWLSKMTRTGLLFPDESRPANEGFSGFGGSSSSSSSGSNSRRGSDASSASGWGGSTTTTQYTNHPPAFAAELDAATRERRANPALLVLTHPQLEGWHRAAIRASVGEYGVGVVFVPLYHVSSDDSESGEEEEEEEDLPVLKPLDPRTMTSFGSFDQFAAATTKPGAGAGTSLEEEEIVFKVNVEGQIEELIQEIVVGARDIMTVS